MPDLTTVTAENVTNADGSAASGTIGFAPTADLHDAAGNVLVTRKTIISAVVDGVMAPVELMPNDHADIQPEGTGYRITMRLDGVSRVWVAVIPATATIDLADLAPAEVSAVFGYATTSALQAHADDTDLHASAPHAATHATGGSDEITPASIGAAEEDHEHEGGDHPDLAAHGTLGLATQAELDAEAATRAAADTALDGRLDTVEATLPDKADLVGGVVPTAQLPAIAVSEWITVADEAAMLALDVQHGDGALRQDNGTRWIFTGDDPAVLADWLQLDTGDAVDSVNGQTGVVVLGAADVGAPTTAALDAEVTAREGVAADLASLSAATSTTLADKVSTIGTADDPITDVDEPRTAGAGGKIWFATVQPNNVAANDLVVRVDEAS